MNQRKQMKKRRQKTLRIKFTLFIVTILFVILVISGSYKNLFSFTEKLSSDNAFTKPEIARDVPLLFQYDSKWADISYGDTDIKTAGCAPTCLSMVIRYLTDKKNITPDEVAKFSEENDYYVDNVGTKWTLMSQGSKSFGVTGTELPLDKSTIFQQLENNHPVICAVGPGDFTTEGHFIVLSGTKDGKLIINDPNNKKRSNKLWNYDKIKGQIRNLWAFEKSS